MAWVAAFSFPWTNPALAPQAQAMPFPFASMYITPVQMENVVPAPYVYNLVPPATPIEAELVALNDSVVQILSL